MTSRKRKSSNNNNNYEYNSTTTTTTLPSDIIEQVLLRLPAPAVVKFKSVSKLFNHLLTNPAFTAAHTSRAAANSPTSLVAFYDINPNKMMNINNTHGASWVPLKMPVKSLRGLSSLEHTCDGLVCFSKTIFDGKRPTAELPAKFVILNPLTGECVLLSIPVNQWDVCVLGFYFHQSSSRYRLLIKVYYSFKYRGERDRYVVLTLGTKQLRSVENLTPYVPVCTRGGHIVVDGKLFIFDREDHSFHSVLVVVFDLESEQFRALPLPDSFSCAKGDTRMFEVEGKLCICNLHHYERSPKIRVKLWVLVDCMKGIWVEKQRVCSRILVVWGREQDYSIVAHCEGRLLHVKLGCEGIALPEKEFTFYYSRTDAIEKMRRLPHRLSQS